VGIRKFFKKFFVSPLPYSGRGGGYENFSSQNFPLSLLPEEGEIYKIFL
jgi:hypothetical protein